MEIFPTPRVLCIGLIAVVSSMAATGCYVQPRQRPLPPPAGGQAQVLVQEDAEVDEETDEAPPVDQVEVASLPPSPVHIWVRGRWTWHGRWVWAPGRWLAPRNGHAWMHGHWEGRGRRHVWIGGHWN